MRNMGWAERRSADGSKGIREKKEAVRKDSLINI
jgi:hypothetical protein